MPASVAWPMLQEADLFASPEEQAGAKQVLTAAALTYIAAFITSVLQLFYYIRIAAQEQQKDRARGAQTAGGCQSQPPSPNK